MNTVVTSTPATQEDMLNQLNSMYRSTADVGKLGKNVANASGKSLHVPKVYVTHAKSSDKSARLMYNIDGTALTPSVATLLSGKFVAAYTNELEAAMNDDSTERNSMRFVEICRLLRSSDQQNAPVSIVSGKYVRRLPDIAKALNTFMNENAEVIKAITTMMNNEIIKDTSDVKS